MLYRRSCFMAATCAVALCIPCSGQTTAPYFKTVTSGSGPTPAHLYAVDVNNDGFTDVIQDSADTAQSGDIFTVSISNGDGTFKAPVSYEIDSNSPVSPPISWGDYNNDGKVDIAVVLPGTNQVAVYLGNGDGTFQAAHDTAVALPSGATFTATPIVTADFNHDGNQDLAAATYNNGVWSIYLLQGDGTGSFKSPSVIYTPTSGWAVKNLVAGDFDTDGNADIAVLESMPCSYGGTTVCSSNVLTLYGNGGTSFQFIDTTTVSGDMSLGSADLNNDGTTDLYGVEYGSNQLAVFLGHYDRKYTYYYTTITPYAAGQTQTIEPVYAVADYDGSWDLAALTASPGSNGSTSYQMIYFLSPGYNPTATIAYGPSPGGNAAYQAGTVAGNFNGDVWPDIATSSSISISSTNSTLDAGLNQQSTMSYQYCNYPSSGNSIRLCAPSTETTEGPLLVEASANSFGQLRKIEFWLDGVKQGEQHLVWGGSGYFNWGLQNPSAGTHNATIYAANIDNTLERYDFTFTIGNTCGTPPQGAYGVNICSPTQDGTYNDPVQITATAKITGTLAHMDVFVDGAKQYTESSSTSLNTSVTLSQSYHTIEVDAVNTAGAEWESTVGMSAEQAQ